MDLVHQMNVLHISCEGTHWMSEGSHAKEINEKYTMKDCGGLIFIEFHLLKLPKSIVPTMCCVGAQLVLVMG